MGEANTGSDSDRREERLNDVMDFMPLPLIEVDGANRIVRANDHAHRVLGAAPGTLPGMEVAVFSATTPDDSARRMCEQMHATGSVERMEIQIRRLDGSLAWLMASAHMLHDGADQRYVLVFADVTPLKDRERQLTEANEEAERNIRARMRFLAAASHDLRQPLQALALFASALDRHVGSEQGRSILQSIKSSLRGMEEMFDALLDMSKLDAGVMTAEIRTFLLGDVLERLEQDFAPQAEAAGLKLHMEPTSIAVRSDPRLVARILGNFLSNAIRYTQSGRILVGARRRGGRVAVHVYDTGRGIPEDVRLEIFQEFRQLGTPAVAGRNSGLGLGLAIVQRLARLLGHPVNLWSEQGKGSCFSLELPIQEEFLPRTADGEFDAGHDAGLGRDLSGLTVVLVDDDQDIRDGLALLLEGWGCRPVVAGTAADALGQLAGAHPDVIMADLHLQGAMCGLAAIRDLHAALGPCPAFLFTGDTDPGADMPFPIIRKPIDPTRLRDVLGEALGR